MSFVRNLLLRGAGVVPVAKPRRPETLPDFEPAEAVESGAIAAASPARPFVVPRDAAREAPPASLEAEPVRSTVRAQAGEVGETGPIARPKPVPTAPTPMPGTRRPAEGRKPGNGREPGKVEPAVAEPVAAARTPAVRGVASLVEPDPPPARMVRETRETRRETETVRETTRPAVAAAEPVRPAPFLSEARTTLDPPAPRPEPASIEVEIGTIEIVQSAPVAPPARPTASRRPQPRGFAGLARQRQYADRRWY